MTVPDAPPSPPRRASPERATTPRAELARAIPRRPRVSWWLTLVLAVVFGLVAMPIAMFGNDAASTVTAGEAPTFTVRVPPFAGYPTRVGRIGGDGGGVLIAYRELASRDDAADAHALADALPRGPAPYFALFAIAAVLAGLFSHHVKRSTNGRLLAVQVVNLALIVVAAVLVKLAMLVTAISILAVPVALFALLPALALDRVVGIATGTLAALIVSLLVPFDVGVAILLLVQTSVAGLVVAERPKQRLRATLVAGGAATVAAAVAYPLVQYLTTGHLPVHELANPARSAWVAAMVGPALATALALVLVPAYQLLVGEITRGGLIELGELSQPLLKQIAEKAPGTWQHSLMMANLAEIAANAIGADARLVRVGALYHDLGKSIHPKYFIENLEPGETSPHDQLPPETSCDAIFGHVTEGLATARRHGLHERLVDFMHMHHGDGVLEYFWAKCQEQGNPKGLTIDDFRYPGVRPQTRETAILAICDAVEAASRTLKKPEPAAIASLVQRIVYGKLHLGQLDESGLSMRDLREIADSLRETLRHANHGRIEYPWQKAAAIAAQSASATPDPAVITTAPRLDSLDRAPARAPSVRAPSVRPPTVKPETQDADAFAQTDLGTRDLKKRSDDDDALVETPRLRQLKVSKDGLPHVEHVRPSDGGIGAAPDAPVVAIDGEPDTGRHRAAKLAHGSAHEIAQFTVDAKRALDDAARDMDVLPPSRADGDNARRESASAAVRRAITEAEPSEAVRRREPSDPPPAARKRAATLPPIAGLARPPTSTGIPRRAPTVPPPTELRRPSSTALPPIAEPAAAPPKPTTSPPPTELRRPSTAAVPAPTDVRQVTGPMRPIDAPSTAAAGLSARRTKETTPTELAPPRTAPPGPPPGPSDFVVGDTTRPAIPPRLRASDGGEPAKRPSKPQALIVERSGDSSPPENVRSDGDAAITQPRMASLASSAGDDAGITEPTMPAAMSSDPAIALPPAPDASPWKQGLAARIDAQLESDFGPDTPVRAPSRAELQALLDVPPDATRELSFDEVERLHRQKEKELRRSEPELEFTRRAHYPTSEVREEDIEAAIEIAPSARRTGSIGIAKTKPKPGES